MSSMAMLPSEGRRESCPCRWRICGSTWLGLRLGLGLGLELGLGLGLGFGFGFGLMVAGCGLRGRGKGRGHRVHQAPCWRIGPVRVPL